MYGNSLITHLVEKLPLLATQALEQFHPSKQQESHKYTDMLERDGSAALYVIAAYEDINLIMHPTIQTCVERKWRQVGRKDAVWQLILALIYSACWTVLIGTFGKNNYIYHDGQGHWDKYGWKVIFEICVVALPVYFLVNDIILHRRSKSLEKAWVCIKRASLQRRHRFCHPSWPNERLLLKKEVENKKQLPSLARSQRFWLVYEYVNVAFTVMVIVTRALSIYYVNSIETLWTHRFIVCLTMLVAYVRLIKILMRFQ